MRAVTSFAFRRASAADDPALRALLQSAGLPFEDVAAERQDFIVAVMQGRVVGCVALETFQSVALLRSLAVVESLRGGGLVARSMIAFWSARESSASVGCFC